MDSSGHLKGPPKGTWPSHYIKISYTDGGTNKLTNQYREIKQKIEKNDQLQYDSYINQCKPSLRIILALKSHLEIHSNSDIIDECLHIFGIRKNELRRADSVENFKNTNQRDAIKSIYHKV